MDHGSSSLLQEGWLPEYRCLLEVLWKQTVDLHARVYLLEKIDNHCDLFEKDHNLLCLSLIADALYESCIMTIWRIACDRGSPVLTLEKFKELILKNARKPVGEDLIRKRLEGLEYCKEIKGIRADIERIRHRWLAHLNRKEVTEAYREQKGIPLYPTKEIKQIAGVLSGLIDSLSFDSQLSRNYLEYSELVIHTEDQDSRSDIVRVLDLLASTNSMLRTPENHPELWAGIKAKLTPRQMEIFNGYRLRLALPPVDT